MSAPREVRLQRRALIVVAIGVALLALFNSSDDEAVVRLTPSTLLNGDGGARALYELSREVGLDSQRWMLPTDEPAFRDRVGLLVLLGTGRSMTSAEADELLAWVRAGGHLFVAPALSGRRETDPLLKALGVRAVERDSDRTWHAAQRPAELQSSEARLLLAGTPAEVPCPARALDLGALPAELPHEVLLETGGHATLALVHAGSGQLVLLADAEALTNAELADSGLLLATLRALAALADGRTVWFDEFHHGYDERASVTSALTRFLLTTHAGWALLALVAVGLLAVVCRGQRLGPPVPEPHGPGRTSLEHVEALAAGWAAARAHARPASLLVEGLRLRLGVAHQRELGERLSAVVRRTPGLAAAVDRIRAASDGGRDTAPVVAAVATPVAAPVAAAGPGGLLPLADAIDAVLAAEGRSALPSGWDARA